MERKLETCKEVVQNLARENARLLVENKKLKCALELAGAQFPSTSNVEVTEWQQKLIEFKSSLEETVKFYNDCSVLESLVTMLDESGCVPPLFISWDHDNGFEYFHIEWPDGAILIQTDPSTKTGLFILSSHGEYVTISLSFEELVQKAKQMKT
jgi:hypothetical protein